MFKNLLQVSCIALTLGTFAACKDQASVVEAPKAVAAVTTADMPEFLFQAGCTACHAQATAQLGPPFVAVAGLYRNADDDGIQRLAAKIRHGGSGNWGYIPMPANPKLSEDDAVRIVHWILSLNPVELK